MKVRKWLIWAMILTVLLSLAGCGARSGGDMMDSEAGYEINSAGSDNLVMESPAAPEVLPENRKLIRTIRMEAETENLDTMVSDLDAKTVELGGYVENREIYNGSSYSQRRYRNANITFRIPAEKLSSFTGYVSGLSNVVSSQETIDDITLQYVDMQSRVTALEVEQERLLALLGQADNLTEILEIESRLTDVRYELESYASQLRLYDNQVDYATVHLTITEVTEYTPVEEQTLWQRISTGFVSNLKKAGEGLVDVLVWLLVNLPFLLIIGGIGVGIWLVVRWYQKKKAKKTPPPPPENP